MTIIFRDRIFQEHETSHHPEHPDRIRIILDSLDLGPNKPPIHQVRSEYLATTHSQAQINQVRTLSEKGGGAIDADTRVSRQSFDVSLRAIGTGIAAVDQVLAGDATNALCLVRPPGHHATATMSMGFCLFNNIAVAANYAIQHQQLDRVLIIDWDVHHGNGTQNIFYESEQVFFLSLHRYPFYPGTGHKSETGTGKGLGYTANYPIELGISRQQYLDTFKACLESACRKIKPQLILVSAGFDAHELDPVGSLGLKASDFGTMTSLVMEAAEDYCGVKVVSMLEGGYHLSALRDSVAAHLDELRKK